TSADTDVAAEESSEPAEKHRACRITDHSGENWKDDLGELEQDQHQRTENSESGNVAPDAFQRAECPVRDPLQNPENQKKEKCDNRTAGKFLKEAAAGFGCLGIHGKTSFLFSVNFLQCLLKVFPCFLF